MFTYSKAEQKQKSKSTVLKKSEKTNPPPNKTGIPNSMKTQFENLSGFSFDDVRVHYNSDKPAQLQALAYTQGDRVFLAPGQEKHLGHELGHVVQQKQGRVQPTMQLQGAAVSDDAALEREADVFGKAIQFMRIDNKILPESEPVQMSANGEVVQRSVLVKDKLNVAGENHPDTLKREESEKIFCEEKSGSKNYWVEYDFRTDEVTSGKSEAPAADREYLKAELRFVGIRSNLGSLDFWYNFVSRAITRSNLRVLINDAGKTAADFPDLSEALSDYERAMDKINENGIIGELNELEEILDRLIEGPDKKGLPGNSADQDEKIRQYRGLKPYIEGLKNAISDFLAKDRLATRLDLYEKYREEKNTSDVKYYGGLIDDQVQNNTILAGVRQAIVNFIGLIDDSGTSYFSAETDRKPVNVARSDGMHKAAFENSQVRGVWKIGESHVQDIIGKYSKPDAYNLLTLSEFNNEYYRWATFEDELIAEDIDLRRF